uniref:16S rRNA (Guanine(966)-N(2))-methyltransferase RsmD n=1 Tax=Leptospirillum ferriphilum TaxID=178606 RepID=A0A7C3LUX3_9BACT
MAPFFLPEIMIRIQTGILKGIQIPHEPRKGLRPSTQKIRESVVNILKSNWAGAFVADLFAGTGAYGLEAFSNGAEKILWIEKDKYLASTLEHFLRERFPDRSKDLSVRKADVLKFLSSYAGKPADILILDPPYRYRGGQDLLSGLWHSAIVGPDTLLILEHHHKDPYVFSNEGKGEFKLLKMYAYGESHVALFRRILA